LTILCTSLLEHTAHEKEGSPLQISTIADTWIHLNYLVKSGERNRALSIVKSRGTAHSNQVRELILSHSGISLSEVYTAGGEVLMGTPRWEKEHDERLERTLLTAEAARQRRELEVETAALEGRLLTLQRELELKRDEQASFEQRSLAITGERLDALEELRGRRSVFHGRPHGDIDV
jgi:circadian clock protein KaiC